MTKSNLPKTDQLTFMACYYLNFYVIDLKLLLIVDNIVGYNLRKFRINNSKIEVTMNCFICNNFSDFLPADPTVWVKSCTGTIIIL